MKQKVTTCSTSASPDRVWSRMTVRELIDVLSSLPPDDPVYLEHFEDGPVPMGEVKRYAVDAGPDRGRDAVFLLDVPPKPSDG